MAQPNADDTVAKDRHLASENIRQLSCVSGSMG
jgi:hypothetical protein